MGDAAAKASTLGRSLRGLVELTLRRLAEQGKIPAGGEREIVFRLDGDGNLRWYEPRAIRVPASELDQPAG